MSLWLPRGYRGEAELEVKRSRFLAAIARVDAETDARALIASVRAAHPKARHHCTAFIIEVPGAQPIERSSDDGEPSGTAGRPMLDALRSAELSQVVAVVTRYFGGTLLGTGGLSRAYGGALTLALDAAPRVTPSRVDRWRVEVPVADLGRVEQALRSAGVSLEGLAIGTHAVTFVAAAEGGGRVPELIAQASRGRALVVDAGSGITEAPRPGHREGG